MLNFSRAQRFAQFIARISLAAVFTVALALLPGHAQAQNIYVSLNGGGAIDKVTWFNGTFGSFTSGLTHPDGVAFGASGNLFVAQTFSGSFNGTIIQVSPDGGQHPFAVGFQEPLGIAFDTSGNLFVADYGTFTIDKVTSDGTVTTFASGLNSPFGVAFDASGNLFVANRDNNTISKVTSDGTVSLFASGFDSPNDLAFDSSGNLFVSNFANGTISMVTPGGSVSTFVDNTQGLVTPLGLAFDSVTGNLFVADQGASKIWEVTPGGTVSDFVYFGGLGPQYLTVEPTAVPEPATYALILSLGVLGLVAFTRRRRPRTC